MTPRERVLVTDGNERAALATVRSLGRAGHPVVVAAWRPRSLAGASRYCAAEVILPDPLQDAAAFIAAMQQTVAREGVRVLMPISEQSLRTALTIDWAARGVVVPFPDAATFARISDKQALLAAAGRLGLAVPAQHVLTQPEQQVPAGLGWPVVVKPSRSVSGQIRIGTAYAVDRSSLASILRGIPVDAYPVLLQQRVVGPGMGIFLLRWDGRRRAMFAHRRLREKPPAGGVSVYCESVAADPHLVDASDALLAAFDWRGVAMIEFKLDTATRTPYVMEVNGRLWGSLQLAVDAGVDFPRLLVDAALGRPLAAPPEYRVGVRSRWWWGDVDHLIARVRRSNAALALPPDAPSRGRALLDFLTLWRPGDRNEVLRSDDPGPFVRETINWVLRR